MRLETTQLDVPHHGDRVTSVVWTPDGTLLSVSDDKTLVQWSSSSEQTVEATVARLDHYAIDMRVWHKAPAAATASTTSTIATTSSTGGGRRTAVTDGHAAVVIGSSDGRLRFMTGNNATTTSSTTTAAATSSQVERVVEAHTGAVTCVRWNHEGTAIATSGEDGCIKQWSQVGRLRSRLVQVDQCVYQLSWSPDNQALVYTHGKHLTIKPLAVNVKQTKWLAHDGIVLQVEWCPANNLIVSGGEDGVYKVWDAFGRQVYSSAPFDYPITAVSWAPNGNVFAVGSFNVLLLCDRTGWVHSRSPTTNNNTGSLCVMDWTPDSTQVAAGASDGSVIFGQVVDRTVEWNNFTVTLRTGRQMVVDDVHQDAGQAEVLDFNDRVLDMCINHGHLVVVTLRQCYVYATTNFGTPHIFDLQGVTFNVQLAERHFLLVDSANGAQVYTYEGRRVSAPRLPGMRPQWLCGGNVSLSDDVVAIIDPSARTNVHLRDVQGAKPLCQPLVHPEAIDITMVALNHHGLINTRKLVFIDVNRNLYMARVHESVPHKVCSMVDSAIWHDTHDILVTTADGQVTVWYYPSAVYIDLDLVPRTRSVLIATDLSRQPQLISCFESRCTLRCADGSLHTLALSPFPAKMAAYCEHGRWAEAVRMCRLLHTDGDQQHGVLWSCLAVMAIEAQELETAELALAALDEVDKVEYMCKIMDIPSVEGRTAELLLYRRRPNDAESTLLQAGLVYRAIKLNLQLYRWDRAMEIAVQHKTHVDTVLYYRAQYLADFQRQEDKAYFIEYGKQVPVDRDTILSKERQEVDKEQQNGSAYQRQRKADVAPLRGDARPASSASFQQPAPVLQSVSQWDAPSSSTTLQQQQQQQAPLFQQQEQTPSADQYYQQQSQPQPHTDTTPVRPSRRRRSFRRRTWRWHWTMHTSTTCT